MFLTQHRSGSEIHFSFIDFSSNFIKGFYKNSDFIPFSKMSLTDPPKDSRGPTPGESPRPVYPEAVRDEKSSSTHHEQKVMEPYKHFEDPQNADLSRFRQEEEKRTKQFFTSPDGNRIRNEAVFSCQDLFVLNLEDPETEMKPVYDPNVTGENKSVAHLSFSPSQQLLAIGVVERDSDDMEVIVKDVSTGLFASGRIGRQKKYNKIEWAKHDRGFFYARYKEPKENEDPKSAKIVREGFFFHAMANQDSSGESDNQVSYKELEKSREPLSMESACVGDSFLVISMQTAKDIDDDITKGSDALRGDDETMADDLIDAVEIGTEQSELVVFSLKEKEKPNYLWKKVGTNYATIGNNGDVFYLVTREGAPMGKVIHAKVFDNGLIELTDLIPESPTKKLQSCRQAGGNVLVVNYSEDGSDGLYFYHIDGDHAELVAQLHADSLEAEPVTITSITLMRNSLMFLYTYETLVSPCVVVEVEIKIGGDQSSSTGEPSPKRSKGGVQVISNEVFRADVPGFDRTKFKISRRKYKSATFKVPESTAAASMQDAKASKDSEEIVVIIAEKLDENGKVQTTRRSCIAYSYGGFNISTKPTFNLRNLYFIDKFNGVFAVALIRGGGERGRRWHESALRERKQQTFDDFRRAIESLVEWGYTSHDQVGITGTSFGGLLMAVTCVQNPTLVKAAVINAAPLDMINYHLFGCGFQWVKELGNISVLSEFEAIMRWWKSLHTIEIGEQGLPAMLILAADGDTRVQAFHSFKFKAELNHAINKRPQAQAYPVYLKVYEKEAGHGQNLSSEQKIELNANQIFFFMKAMGLRLSVDND